MKAKCVCGWHTEFEHTGVSPSYVKVAQDLHDSETSCERNWLLFEDQDMSKILSLSHNVVLDTGQVTQDEWSHSLKKWLFHPEHVTEFERRE